MFFIKDQSLFHPLDKEIYANSFSHSFGRRPFQGHCCVQEAFEDTTPFYSPRQCYSCRRPLISFSENQNHYQRFNPFVMFGIPSLCSSSSCIRRQPKDEKTSYTANKRSEETGNKEQFEKSADEVMNWETSIQLPNLPTGNVKVEVKGGSLVVEAKKEEPNDFVFYKHERSLPKNMDAKLLSATISGDGRLLVTTKPLPLPPREINTSIVEQDGKSFKEVSAPAVTDKSESTQRDEAKSIPVTPAETNNTKIELPVMEVEETLDK